MSRKAALLTIARLAPGNFDMTLVAPGKSPVDVYKTRCLVGMNWIDIYVMLAIKEDGDLLLIISFHK